MPQLIDMIEIWSKKVLDNKKARVLNIVVVCLTPLHFERLSQGLTHYLEEDNGKGKEGSSQEGRQEAGQGRQEEIVLLAKQQ